MTHPDRCRGCRRAIRHRTEPDDGRLVHKARGMCGGCYQAAQRTGDLPPLLNPGRIPRCMCGRRLETPNRRMVGACTICTGHHARRPLDHVVEDAEWLASTGVIPDVAAERLGMATASLERALYRAGRDDVLAALRRNAGTT